MSRSAARYGLLVALAMVLSWLESLFPLPAALPGMKLGLTNLVVLFALYRMGPRPAAAVSLARVLLVSMTFGNAYSLAYSLAGAAAMMVFSVAPTRGKLRLMRAPWSPRGALQ